MNWLSLITIGIGVLYLIYSIVYRNKVTYYNKRKAIIIIKKERFLKLQLYFAIINSAYLIILGITVRWEVNYRYSILVPLGFHLINWLLMVMNKKKGFFKYE